jgi:multidrug efflux pump subunit AcrA (membrane-fusion protein)
MAVLLLALAVAAWIGEAGRSQQDVRSSRSAAIVRTQAGETPARGPKPEPELTKCLVVAIEDRNVPAEEAGVLRKVNVEAGDDVEKAPAGSHATGEDHPNEEADEPDPKVPPLVQIDPSLPIRQRKVAQRELRKADAEARNTVNREYAVKASEVAWAAWQKAEEAHRKVANSVSAIERQRLKLEWERAKLQIKQAEHETSLAELTAGVKEEELGAASDSIKRRRIYSPISGRVVQVFVEEGEWVKPGDPVLRVVNLKRLRVQGLVQMAKHAPREVARKAVTVTATLTDGRKEQFSGKVQFVHPEIQAGGVYMVWAEVDNRQDEGGEYLLQPGMDVDMVIHTRGAPRAAQR